MRLISSPLLYQQLTNYHNEKSCRYSYHFNYPRWRRILAKVWHWLIEPSPVRHWTGTPSASPPPNGNIAAPSDILDFFSLILSLFDVFTKPGDPKSVTSIVFGITLAYPAAGS